MLGLLLISLQLSCRTGSPPMPLVAPVDAAATTSVMPLADWLDPPAEARPTARWWWPGGSVDEAGMAAHLSAIQRAGFGAVEIQPLLLGLSEQAQAADPAIRSVGTPEFFSHVQRAVALAAEQGLAVDLTLGSGWPGGLPTERDRAERQLLLAAVDVVGPQVLTAPLPPAPSQSSRRAVERILDVMGPMDTEIERVAVLGARLDGDAVIAEVIDLTAQTEGATLRWQVPPGRWQVMVFYTNTTAHFVMGGAYPGRADEALVVDHLSSRGAAALLEGFGVPAMEGLPHGTVRSVFVDSFELMGELPFTAGFLAAFQAQHGYALTPHLPLVFLEGGESKYAQSMDRRGRLGAPRYRSTDRLLGERVREDYEATRQALFHDAFLSPIRQWVHDSGASFRLQAHGGYGDYLDTYAMADIPESEGLFGDGSADFLSLAASAAHVAGRRWASSEAFIQLRLARTRLSVDELHMLAGRAYAAGINRLVFHGLPYPYRLQSGRWWYPFPGGFGENLAGPLPITNHFDVEQLQSLSGFNQTLSRMSVAMSHGQPVAEVAWLRSAPRFPDQPSIDAGRLDPDLGTSATSRALRAQGLGHDRVSRHMLAQADLREEAVHIGAQRYQALLLDPLPVAEPALIERIASIAEGGVPVIALGALPQRAPGLADADARDQRVRSATRRLEAHVIAADADRLQSLLAAHVPSALLAPQPGEALPFSMTRRQGPAGELVLLFNASLREQTAALTVCREGGAVTLWDPQTGSRERVRERIAEGEGITMSLQPAQTQILTIAWPL